MQYKLHLSALVAISVILGAPCALAQNAGAAGVGVAPGTGSVPPVGAPASPGSAGISAAPGTSATTGMGTGAVGTGTGLNGGINQPGVPNTSTPGIIGTGASPSGLPGDDPAHPGFPGRVGQ
jgi:hypothetical protein